MPKFAVIIPAAGASSRFGGKVKKPFVKLDGREIVLRSIELFTNRDDVVQTLLAIAPADLAHVKERYGANLGFMGVQLVEGGAARADTVRKALAAVRDDADYVVIHDAVRPFVTNDHLDRVFSEATKTGAAILATPLTSTLKKVAGSGVIDATVPRDSLWAAQTPQVFRKDIYAAAVAALPGDAKALEALTDDAQVVEQFGHPVSVVEGPAYNIKITSHADLPLAEAILKAMPKKKVSALGAFEDAQW